VVDDDLEVLAGLVGLLGDGSREARGDGAADDWAEV